jgi:hypothetical protein
MHWPAALACAEAPRSRYQVRYLGGYVRRGLANPQARKLMDERGHWFAQAELEIQREMALERYKAKAQRRKVVA